MIFYKKNLKTWGQKTSNIYENGALGGRSSDGGDQNPGGGVILPEAGGGGPWANILIDIYIHSFHSFFIQQLNVQSNGIETVKKKFYAADRQHQANATA